MPKRHHFKQTEPLADRLATFAKVMRERAETLPPGPDKTAALAKADQAETTIKMEQWVRSSELKPPAD